MELAAQLDDAGTRSADAVARLWRAGELSAKKDGIGVYKVPLCLVVSGQHGLANNALDEIVASLQRSPGVFARSGRQRSCTSRSLRTRRCPRASLVSTAACT